MTRNSSYITSFIKKIFYFTSITTLLVSATPGFADCNCCTPVDMRALKERLFKSDFFGVALYKPTYFLPYYYTGTPNNTPYLYDSPDDPRLSHSEVKYQISFKVPLWKNIYCRPSSLYFAYTQLSFWQIYNSNKRFVRENNYEPEFFLANEVNYPLFKNWHANFLNLGAVHQSNGYGDYLERSWNRVYLEAITSVCNWMIDFKPWFILHDQQHNPHIGYYLGYEQLIVSYKFGNNQVVSLNTRNLLESGGTRGSAELTWSFPITPYLKGFTQVFSGYGQSLMEYNHRTTSAGVGVALNDWV